MTNLIHSGSRTALTPSDKEALAQFRRDLECGGPWYLALLDAVALWSSADEISRGRRFCYLVANEAFDWLRLAERLCNEAMDLLPADEVERLLFYGEAPLDMDEEDFRRRIGPAKYRAHLNYFYGVTVEQALHLAVEEELRKEGLCGGRLDASGRERGDPFERIYGVQRSELLARFCTDTGRPQPREQGLSLDDFNAFLYWLFKYRLKWCDGARVASDTKKGLSKLQQLRRHLRKRQSAPPEPELVSV